MRRVQWFEQLQLFNCYFIKWTILVKLYIHNYFISSKTYWKVFINIVNSVYVSYKDGDRLCELASTFCCIIGWIVIYLFWDELRRVAVLLLVLFPVNLSSTMKLHSEMFRIVVYQSRFQQMDWHSYYLAYLMVSSRTLVCHRYEPAQVNILIRSGLLYSFLWFLWTASLGMFIYLKKILTMSSVVYWNVSNYNTIFHGYTTSI